MWIQANACVSRLLQDYTVKNALYVFASDSPFRGASLVAQMVKESACNAGDPGSIPRSGRSGEGNSNPLQYSCLVNPVDREACPWGCKESDMTE